MGTQTVDERGRTAPFINCTDCLLSLGLLMPDPGMTAAELAAIWNARQPEPLVIESDRPLSAEQRQRIGEQLEAAAEQGTAIVLDRGLRLARPHGDALPRIEAKVDRLLAALEDEGEGDDGAGQSLDAPASKPRVPGTL